MIYNLQILAFCVTEQFHFREKLFFVNFKLHNIDSDLATIDGLDVVVFYYLETYNFGSELHVAILAIT